MGVSSSLSSSPSNSSTSSAANLRDLSVMTAAEVSQEVNGLGDAYLKYEAALLATMFNGKALLNMNEEEINDCFDEVGISSKSHRRVIITHFSSQFAKPLTGGGSASGNPNAQPSPPASPNDNTNNSNSSNNPDNSSNPPTPPPNSNQGNKPSGGGQKVPARKTTVFITHDWGINEDGSINHDVASKINKFLQDHGIETWFDEQQLTGDLQYQMAEGIENTKVVIALVTRRYLGKVNSEDVRDNCAYEFGHAVRVHGSPNIIPVVMESSLIREVWLGKGGAALGGRLFVDMTDHKNPASFEKSCLELVQLVSHAANKSNPAYSISAGGKTGGGSASPHPPATTTTTNYNINNNNNNINSNNNNSSSSNSINSNSNKAILPSSPASSSTVDRWSFLMTKTAAELATMATNLPSAGKKHKQLSYEDESATYEGELVNGVCEGLGVLRFSDGDIYRGTWKNDKREGRGVHLFSNGNRYEGDYKNGNREGRGVYLWPSGSRYEGDWKNDDREGRGVHLFFNGDRYEGDYMNDTMEGRGKYTSASGQVQDGLWKDDKFLG
jgi:hypothetical protein